MKYLTEQEFTNKIRQLNETQLQHVIERHCDKTFDELYVRSNQSLENPKESSTFIRERGLFVDSLIYSIKQTLLKNKTEICSLANSKEHPHGYRIILNINENDGIFGISYNPMDNTYSVTNRMCACFNSFNNLDTIFPVSETQEKQYTLYKSQKTYTINEKIPIQHEKQEAEYLEYGRKTNINFDKFDGHSIVDE